MKENKSNSKRIILVSATAVFFLLSATSYLFFKNKKTSQSSSDFVAKNFQAPPPPERVLEASPITVNLAKKLLDTPIGNKSEDADAMQYMNKLMVDKNISTFFNYTLEFFGRTKESYPAARFVALTLVLDASPEQYYLMSWTKTEMKKYSKELMQTLISKKDEIAINPYFHNRMLNLAHTLDVPLEQKMEIFSDTLARPLYVSTDGNLAQQSQIVEVALILMKQATHNPSEAAPSIARSIASNPEPEQKKALHARVMNYYPQLDYLFK
jgi:hypothetical protein